MEATNLISRATPNLCVGGNVWRHQELLVRLAKYSSAFVRKQVPLDGRLLVLVDTVLMPAQPAAMRASSRLKSQPIGKCAAPQHAAAILPLPQPRSATSECGGSARTNSSPRGHAL